MELETDGTATGCLCAVAEAIKRGTDSLVVFSRPGSTRSLFSEGKEVPSDPVRAGRFLNYLAERSSKQAVHTLLRALVAMPDGIESALLGYARNVLRYGAAVDQAHADADVAFIHRYARKVSLEIHRFKGLLRFQEFTSGRLVALYTPDYDITLPLAFHFRRRLAGQSWLILDCRRCLAATWNGERLNAEHPQGELLAGDLPERSLAGDAPTDAEARTRQLWKVFHKTVAIENRRDTRLQRQFMPVRYWTHLTEMQ